MYIDILLFALIAGFILFKLYNILGTETEESIQAVDSIMKRSAQIKAKKIEVDEDEKLLMENLPLDQAQKIAKLKELQGDFHLGKFLQSVEKAFETIIKAFKEYDLEAISFLTSGEAKSNFENNIKDLQDKQRKLNIEIISLKQKTIKDVKISRDEAEIAVEFISEQVFYTEDQEGNIISGDIHKVEEITDCWSFKKDLRDASPVWKLVSVNV